MPIIEELSELKDNVTRLAELIASTATDPSKSMAYEKMKFETMEKFVIKIYGNENFFTTERRTKGNKQKTIFRARLIDGGDRISSYSYETLVTKLYQMYASGIPQNLLEAFRPATAWKAGQNVSGKTIREYTGTFNRLIAPYPIARIRLKTISIQDLQRYFEDIVAEKKLTRKQASNIRNTLSYIMKYCTREGLIKYDCLQSVDFNNLPYARTSQRGSIKTRPFTPEQTTEILKICEYEIYEKPWPVQKKHMILYPVAVEVALKMGLRSGEIMAIKLKNIDKRSHSITVTDQRVQTYDIDDDMNLIYAGRQDAGHVKGYEAEHTYAVPDDVWLNIAQAIMINADSDPDAYLFPEGQFRYNTLNNTVKRYAKEIGLDGSLYSTHSLRATAATNLYLHTHDIYQVQALLHHTDVQMTMKYIKDLDISQKLKESLKY